jgi:hypothetical protein
MPFALPRNRTDQAAYNRQLQERFASTRRVAPAVPAVTAGSPVEALEQLDALHRAGVLTDAELAAARSRLRAP